MANQLEVVSATIAEFSANHKDGFTLTQLASHYKIPEKLAKRILGEIDGLTSVKSGDIRIYSFVSSKPKRAIKTGDAERAAKVTAYFKAACYNARKIGQTREMLRAELEAMMTEYDVETLDEPEYDVETLDEPESDVDDLVPKGWDQIEAGEEIEPATV